MTLPAAALFGLMVWLLEGLVQRELWLQFGLFVLSVYLLVELSNQNALLRVRSRMVSSTFIMLSCAACFLLPDMRGALLQLCIVVAFLMSFQAYQNPQAVGDVYFAFVSIGVGSMAFVQLLWYVPLLWLLLSTQLQAMSWRTWLASLLGLVTPYWFAMVWLLYQQDFSLAVTHFSALGQFGFSLQQLTLSRILVFAFLVILSAAGVIHFWSYSFEEKIRIRLIYGFLTSLLSFTLLFIVLQPQHYDALLRIAVVCASPLIAHVFTFTASRISNILFFVTAGLAVVIAAFSLWTQSLIF